MNFVSARERSGPPPYPKEITEAILSALEDFVAKSGGERPAARKLGVSQPTVNRWRNGVNQMQLSALVDLRNASSVPLDEILKLPALPLTDRSVDAALAEVAALANSLRRRPIIDQHAPFALGGEGGVEGGKRATGGRRSKR